MNFDNTDISKIVDSMQNAIEENHERIASGIIPEQEYNGMLEDCVFETCDILRKMQENSERESKLNRRRFWISLVVSLIAAAAAVISALPYILP